MNITLNDLCKFLSEYTVEMITPDKPHINWKKEVLKELQEDIEAGEYSELEVQGRTILLPTRMYTKLLVRLWGGRLPLYKRILHKIQSFFRI